MKGIKDCIDAKRLENLSHEGDDERKCFVNLNDREIIKILQEKMGYTDVDTCEDCAHSWAKSGILVCEIGTKILQTLLKRDDVYFYTSDYNKCDYFKL